MASPTSSCRAARDQGVQAGGWYLLSPHVTGVEEALKEFRFECVRVRSKEAERDCGADEDEHDTAYLLAPTSGDPTEPGAEFYTTRATPTLTTAMTAASGSETL